MSDCHVHAVLHLLLRLVRELRLVAHVLALVEAGLRHAHGRALLDRPIIIDYGVVHRGVCRNLPHVQAVAAVANCVFGVGRCIIISAVVYDA